MHEDMWGINLTTERGGGKVTWHACTLLAYPVHHSSLFEFFQICVQSTLNVTCVMEWRISVLLQGWQYESGRKLLWVSDLVYDDVQFRRGLLWALCSILLPLFSRTCTLKIHWNAGNLRNYTEHHQLICTVLSRHFLEITTMYILSRVKDCF